MARTLAPELWEPARECGNCAILARWLPAKDGVSVATEALRAFVAVPVPDELLAPVQRVQQRLQSGLPKGAVRWIPPEQVHLTLMFLGNVARAHLAELKAALETVCRHSPALALRAAG